jgi:hypothetical protein
MVVSPESLDAYIRVTKPGALLFTAALFVLAAAVLIWGGIGTFPKTLTVNGILYDNGEAVCYIEASRMQSVPEGCKVKIRAADGSALNGEVRRVSEYPMSGAEIEASQPNEWLADMLSVNGYAYEAVISADRADIKTPALVSVTLITAEIRPLSLLFD